jgi:hypothetical protein
MNNQQQQREPAGQTPPTQSDDERGLARITLTPDEARAAASALGEIDWARGLTRLQIRRRYPQLPQAIFLRLPASKRYPSAAEALRDAGLAASRAEGEYLGAHPDLPEAESLAEGGPPAWGPSPLFTIGGVENSGSAEDTSGIIEGD